MSARTVPEGCQHQPPCPNRRACRKYANVKGRDIASTMMAIDDMMAALRHLQRGLRIMNAVPVELLAPAEQHERQAMILEVRDLIMRVNTVWESADNPPRRIAIPTWAVH